MKKLGPINPDIENWDLLLLACGKIDDLIDLVNSQQEAIKKLEKVITRETVRIATDDIIDALSGSEEPIEMVSKARYAEKLGIHDTHRTVTLRIPKGMTVGKAIWSTLDQRDENCLYRLFEQSDTDLQKALDEVEHE